MNLQECIARVLPLDQEASLACEKRWDSIAKPLKSLGKMEANLIQIAGILQKNGTPVVAVTSSGENSLNRIADYNLFVPAKDAAFRSGAMASRTAQLYIIDLLYALYCSLNYDENIQKIQQTRISSNNVS